MMIAVPESWNESGAAGIPLVTAPDGEALLGTLIGGRYRLDEIIGRGGMATVFRGHDMRLARDVAVKVSAPCDGQSPPLREERVSSALIHNHIVSIFDAGDIPAGEPGAGCAYIVMQYIHGTTAQEIAPVPWQRAVEIVRQTADGLAAAHARGIIHCDVKPSNLLIDSAGRVLVADFGVAAEVESEIGDYVHGSPAYIAPERLHGERPDPRVDIFGLGGVLAFLLTGQKPPVERTPNLPPGTPEALTRIIARARSIDPADRYANAGELRDVLADLLPSDAPVQHPPSHAPSQATTRRVNVPSSSPRRVVRRAQPAPPTHRRPTGTTVLPALDAPLGTPAVTGRARSLISGGGRSRPAVLIGAVLVTLMLLGIGASLLRDGTVGDPTVPAAAAGEMPDVRGQTFGPAVELLAEQGITVDRIEIVYADNYLNEVVVQSPAPGEDVEDGDVVTLVVRTSR